MTTGKTIALNIWAFVQKIMSLLFNMLCRFAISFLPRSKHLLMLQGYPCTNAVIHSLTQRASMGCYIPGIVHHLVALTFFLTKESKTSK